LGAPSEEHRANLSNSLKGKKKSIESIRKRLETMAKKSPEEKEKIRQKQRIARSKQIFSKESLLKAADARRGQKRSEETREKMRKSHLKKVNDDLK
jgi:hypothetical protein